MAQLTKKGHDAVIPVPETLITEVTVFRVKLGGAFAGLVFPSAKNRDEPLSADVFGWR